MGEKIAAVQQQFYENNCSFMICELQKDVENLLDKKELLEFMNVTPTESEAWDIVQMEEIEREFLGDMDKIGISDYKSTFISHGKQTTINQTTKPKILACTHHTRKQFCNSGF